MGVAIFDRLEVELRDGDDRLVELQWTRRELENYIALPDALVRFARSQAHRLEGVTPGQAVATSAVHGPQETIFSAAAVAAMKGAIDMLVPPVARSTLADPWWINTKISDEFLERLFQLFYETLGLPNNMLKNNYHMVAAWLRPGEVDREVADKLDQIVAVARRAQPRNA